jgi:hypothetical protein
MIREGIMTQNSLMKNYLFTILVFLVFFALVIC